jgi:hypothetical protein
VGGRITEEHNLANLETFGGYGIPTKHPQLSELAELRRTISLSTGQRQEPTPGIEKENLPRHWIGHHESAVRKPDSVADAPKCWTVSSKLGANLKERRISHRPGDG